MQVECIGVKPCVAAVSCEEITPLASPPLFDTIPECPVINGVDLWISFLGNIRSTVSLRSNLELVNPVDLGELHVVVEQSLGDDVQDA